MFFKLLEEEVIALIALIKNTEKIEFPALLNTIAKKLNMPLTNSRYKRFFEFLILNDILFRRYKTNNKLSFNKKLANNLLKDNILSYRSFYLYIVGPLTGKKLPELKNLEYMDIKDWIKENEKNQYSQ